jgi:predicted transposase YdaD
MRSWDTATTCRRRPWSWCSDPKPTCETSRGVYERHFPGKPPYLRFDYQVIRVWQLPVDNLLTGGLGLLPLAPISAVSQAALPEVVERMKRRLPREKGPAGDIWTATRVLMGLRYPSNLVKHLLREVLGMKESVTYQEIVEEGVAKGRVEGRIEGAREVLLLQGEQLYGPPDARSRKALDATSDHERLVELALRLRTAKSWAELLGLPPSRRSRKS